MCTLFEIHPLGFIVFFLYFLHWEINVHGFLYCNEMKNEVNLKRWMANNLQAERVLLGEVV